MPLPTVDLTQRDTVRLISTGRLEAPVLSPLAANYGALEDLASLESVTNGRLQAQETGLPGFDPRELVFGRAGYTFINAAFTHTRPGGNRFNGEDRGYPIGQTLAKRLRAGATSNGIVYPSVRHAGGVCLVAFRPDLVQNLRQGGIWRLEWLGMPTPMVTRMS